MDICYEAIVKHKKGLRTTWMCIFIRPFMMLSFLSLVHCLLELLLNRFEEYGETVAERCIKAELAAYKWAYSHWNLRCGGARDGATLPFPIKLRDEQRLCFKQPPTKNPEKSVSKHLQVICAIMFFLGAPPATLRCGVRNPG